MPLIVWGIGGLLVAGLWGAKSLLGEWNTATGANSEGSISTINLIAVAAVAVGALVLLHEMSD